jgi:CubicO group peptidase (beta-lactamase class C family)
MTKTAFLFFLFLNLGLKAQTGLYVPELVNFDAAMLNLINQYDVPGGELAITYKGRLVYNRGFGYADKTNQALVQPNHIFRLASVSKPITAITIMHLVEQGLLNLDDLVFGTNGILNDMSYQNMLDSRVYNITVRNLLSHSGGWDRNISGDPMFNSYAIATTMGVTPPANSVTVMRYVLSRQMLDFGPGTQYQYSNFGFCILGRVIEKVTGQNYDDYVRNTILLPLNITDMYLGFNLLSNQLPMEVNYYDYPNAPYTSSVYDNITRVPWTYGGFNIEAMDAHGAWVASAEDLCKLLVAIDGFSTKPDILLPATINTMTFPSATNANYALGWAVNSNNDWGHSGSLPGTITEIVRGNNQINWVILLNTRPYNSSQLSSAVGNLVWNVIPTLTSWPSNDLFTGLEESANEASINAFPNPSSGKFTINSNGNISSIEIYNELGEKIYTNSKLNKQTSHDIDLSNSPKGIYFLKIHEGRKIQNKKIILH